jgi:chromosome segregation ATPase
MKKTLSLFIPFLFLGCDKSEPEKGQETPQAEPKAVVETAPKAEHERLLGEAEAVIQALERELTHQVQSFETAFKAKDDEIDALEVKVLELTALVTDYKKQVKDSKNSLNELKRMGSAEYRDIYERAKTVNADDAIRLYEEFIEKYPDSPIVSKARAQIRKLLAEKKVLENRRNASTLRTWETRLKGQGMYVRETTANALYEVIGRTPDSSKKGSSSEFKQMTYVWRDYVLGKGGVYYDLVVERTDGKVEEIGLAERK